uniref:UDP-glucose 6-dehydrogenase n=1 Tax=Rhizophora mucronata TaxID=61149 RepID=A0A2P2ISP4_RHIMU
MKCREAQGASYFLHNSPYYTGKARNDDYTKEKMQQIIQLTASEPQHKRHQSAAFYATAGMSFSH